MNIPNKLTLKFTSAMLCLAFLLTQSSAALAENSENRIRLAQNAPVIPQQDPNLLNFRPVNSFQTAQLNLEMNPNVACLYMQTLEKALDDFEPDIRKAVVAALIERIDNPTALKALEKALDDFEPSIRKPIVEALIPRIDDNPAVLKILEKALDDFEPSIRKAVVAALIERMNNPAVLKVLEKALDDFEPDIRKTVVNALLGKIDAQPVASRRGLCFIGASLAEGAQVSDGPKAKMLKWFIEVFGNDNFTSYNRKESIETLLGKAELGLIVSTVKTLKEKKPGIYLAFVETLGYIRNPKATSLLIAALESENAKIRVAAVEGLSHEGLSQKGLEAIEPLEKALKDKDSRVRKAAAEGLAFLVESGVIREPGPMIEALGRALMYKDKDLRLRKAILISLGATRNQIDNMIEHLSSSIAIVKALAATKSPKAIGPLKIALEYGDPYVREAAVEALENMVFEVPEIGKDPRTVDFLMVALKDKKPNIREAAVRVSRHKGIRGNPRIVDFLMEAMKDKKLNNLLAALEALKECALYGGIDITKASGVIEEALRHKNSRIRKAAADVLDNMNDPNKTDLLVSALEKEDNADVCIAIIDALGDINSPKAIMALTRELDNSNSRVCAATVKALFNIEDSGTFGLLVSRLQISGVDANKGLNSKTALETLESFGDVCLSPKDSRIAGALKDDDLRDAALGALDKIMDTEVAIRITGKLNRDGLCFIGTLAENRRVRK